MEIINFNELKDTLQRTLNVDESTFNGINKTGAEDILLAMGRHVVRLYNAAASGSFDLGLEGFGKALWEDCSDSFAVDEKLVLFVQRVPDAVKALADGVASLEEKETINMYCQAYKHFIRKEVRRYDLRYRPDFDAYNSGYTQTPKTSLVFIASAVYFSADPAVVDWKSRKDWLKDGIRTKTSNPAFNGFVQRVRRATNRGGSLGTKTIEAVALAMAQSRLVKDYTQAVELLRIAATCDSKDLDAACKEFDWYNKINL